VPDLFAASTPVPPAEPAAPRLAQAEVLELALVMAVTAAKTEPAALACYRQHTEEELL